EVNLNAQGGDSYVWSPIDGLSDPEIADPTASPSDTTTYTVTVSLGNGCSSTDQVTVNVNLLPEVSAGEDVGYLCLGDSIQLNATPGYEAYSWTPTVGLSDPNIPDPVTAPTISLEVDYIVTVTDINDCQNSDTVTVTVNPLVPTDAGPDTMICQGEPVTLGAIPVSPDGTTFAWSPTIAMNDSTLENPTVNPEITTTYTVVTNNSICSGSDEVTVIVEESPEISFEIEAVPSCTGLKVNFLNTGDSGLDYIWDLGDGTTSTDLSPSNEYTFDALYTILLTGISDMNCSYTLEEILDASEFTDYFDIVLPNVFTPNGDGENDEFNINITGEIEECFYMEIFNRWGQTVFNASGNNTRWDGYTTAGELVQPGVYFYVIEFNEASYKGSVQVIR
ncbi:MAG: gliding motility-associated C-terminal domain-containing protein, partial [Flavobacteriales bacterium]|nr:gliding motility-associated C-terminal domain-containing protein [Flavobacteriales bacterium]